MKALKTPLRHWWSAGKMARFSDKGCQEAKRKGYNGRCVDCPFPYCLDEYRFTPSQIKRMERKAQIIQMIREGETKESIAQKLHICVRTVERDLVDKR